MADKYILKGPAPKKPLYPHSVGIQLFYTLKQLAKTERIAFIDITKNYSLSYKDYFESTVKLAIYLKNLGYHGKVIGVCCETRMEFFVPFVVGLYLGSPIVPINPDYSSRELLHVLEITKPSLVFCSNDELIEKLRIGKQTEYIKKVLKIEDIYNLTEERIQFETFSPLEVNPKEQIAVLFFSSGTTGLPKAVAHSHSNLSYVQRVFNDKDYILSTFTNYLLSLPFYHAYGCYIVLTSLIKGHTIKFMNKFDPTLFLSSIEKYKVTHISLIPPLMVFLAKHPLVEKYDVSSLKIIVTAAASCSAELEAAVIRRLSGHPTVYNVYGLTETSFVIVSVPVNQMLKCGSVGKPDAGVECKIRDPDSNKSLGANQIGEICFRGDMIMKGYYGCPEATKNCITKDGWLLTGDLGYYDEEGYMYVVDRLRELIKFKGYQVAPAELEGLLIGHPKISDAAVVGYPDEYAGELPTAFVVKKQGVEVNEEEIKDFVKGQVSYQKRLHGGVRFVEVIPKTGSGKILRRELRDLLAAKSLKSKLS